MKERTVQAQMGPQHSAFFLKFAVDMAPLAVFFISNRLFGIFYATAIFMAATIISLLTSKILFKRIPILTVVTGVFVMIFGSLTIYLQDDTFIKIKPTVINLLFAALLLAGIYFKRPVLKLALGEMIELREEGWRILTNRWIVFFVVLAVLNEIIWRNYSTETWVAFKSFGIMPITMIFMMTQISVFMKYQIMEKPDPSVQNT